MLMGTTSWNEYPVAATKNNGKEGDLDSASRCACYGLNLIMIIMVLDFCSPHEMTSPLALSAAAVPIFFFVLPAVLVSYVPLHAASQRPSALALASPVTRHWI